MNLYSGFCKFQASWIEPNRRPLDRTAINHCNNSPFRFPTSHRWHGNAENYYTLRVMQFHGLTKQWTACFCLCSIDL